MKNASALLTISVGVMVAVLAAAITLGPTTFAAEKRVLYYGNLEYTNYDKGYFHGETERWHTTLKWPVGWWERGTLCFHMPYYTFESITLTNIDGTQTVGNYCWGYPWGSGPGGGPFYIKGGEKGIMEWRKYYPPYVETDGVPKRPYPEEDDVDLTMGPDQRMEIKGRTGAYGVRSHRFYDVWTNQNHDDYIIMTHYWRPDWIRDPDAEVVVTHPAQVVIMSMGDGMYYQATSVGVREYDNLAYDIWHEPDEWISWMIRPVEDYGLDNLQGATDQSGNRVRDSLLVLYQWDEDNEKNTVEPYDLGDPAEVDGEFLSYQIPGHTILFASREPVKHEETRPEDWGPEPDWYMWTEENHTIYTEIDENRNPTGKIYKTWAEYYYDTYYSTSGMTPEQVNQGYWSQPVAVWTAGQMSEMWGSWRRNPPDTWQYMTLPKRLLATIETGTDTNPRTIYGKYGFLFMGPYCINKTDEVVRQVYAMGVGGVGPDSARTMGARWHAGQMTPEEKRELVLGGGGRLVNPLEGNNWQVWYKGGRDSLFKTLERAYWNFLGRGSLTGRGYDVPDPLPPPSLVVTSGPDRIDLKWWYDSPDYYKDADTGVDDWKEWRVYRKKGDREVGALEERGTTDPDMLNYRLVHVETSKGEGDTIRWSDTDVQRGQPYYYYVTAVDDGSQNTTGICPGQELESSKMANRTEIGAVPFKPAATNTDNVRVVPNPYNVNSGAGNYTGSAFDYNKILFVNLPAYCKIYIYTESGDLVKVINHNTRNADHPWEQLTDSGQYVRSGIYIARITEATNEARTEHYPDAIVKFVIIR